MWKPCAVSALERNGAKVFFYAALARFLVDFAIGEDFFHFAPRLGGDEEDALVRGAGVGLAGLEPALDFGLVERDRLAADGKF